MADERAKYSIPALASAQIEQFLREALDDTFSESDHLRTLQNACHGLRDAVHAASDCPSDIHQYVRGITNACQHWRSKVRGAAQYLHRALPALKRLASGNDASTKEIADMAVMERLMDEYAQTRMTDPNDPLNDPDLAARRQQALEHLLAEYRREQGSRF